MTDPVTLSDKQKYNKGDYVWIEVAPVRWLLDEDTHILISEYILSISNSLTNAQAYLEKYLSHDIAKEIAEISDTNQEKRLLLIAKALIEKIKNIKDETTRNLLYQKIEDAIKTYMLKKEKLNQARKSGKPFLTLEPENVISGACERQLEALENEIIAKLNDNVIHKMYDELFKEYNGKAR